MHQRGPTAASRWSNEPFMLSLIRGSLTARGMRLTHDDAGRSRPRKTIEEESYAGNGADSPTREVHSSPGQPARQTEPALLPACSPRPEAAGRAIHRRNMAHSPRVPLSRASRFCSWEGGRGAVCPLFLRHRPPIDLCVVPDFVPTS